MPPRWLRGTAPCQHAPSFSGPQVVFGELVLIIIDGYNAAHISILVLRSFRVVRAFRGLPKLNIVYATGRALWLALANAAYTLLLFVFAVVVFMIVGHQLFGAESETAEERLDWRTWWGALLTVTAIVTRDGWDVAMYRDMEVLSGSVGGGVDEGLSNVALGLCWGCVTE